MRFPLVILSLMISCAVMGQHPVINEISACEDTDWIELYNPTSEWIQIDEYFLSDDPNEILKWNLPELILGPEQFIIIEASNNGYSNSANFKLKCSGESLVLSNSYGNTVSDLSWPSLAEGISFGRCPDGAIEVGKLIHQSPGSSNDQNALITLSHDAGFYPAGFNLMLNCSNPNLEMRFTLDGREPTPSDQLYEEALTITDIHDQPDVISNIVTSIHPGPTESTAYKGTVLKAAAFQGSQMIGLTKTATYFISPNALDRFSDFDVVSLSLDQAALFDPDSGIYVPGIHLESSNLSWTGNYFQRGREWERLANLQYFDSNGELKIDQQIGVRIHGDSGRRNRQKSLRLYARNEYHAKHFGENLFEERDHENFKRLILRSGFSDKNRTLIKDLASARLTDGLDLGASAGKPVVVFINGEYWGLHDLREYLDPNYLEYQYGVDKDEVDLLSGNAELNELINGQVHAGSNEGWEQVVQHILTNDLSNENRFQQLAELVDMSSLIEYYCAEIFLNNHDWPKKNYKFWRENDPVTPFKYLLHDLDAGWGFQDPAYNMVEHATTMDAVDGPNPPHSNRLFANLLDNEGFVNDFLNRMACLMVNEFSQENLNDQIDQAVEDYEHGIEEHWNRWYSSPSSSWMDSVNHVLYDFTEQRHAYMIQHIELYFGINFDPEQRCLFATSVDESESENSVQFMVYPNPASETVKVYMNADDAFTFSVHDALGKCILSVSRPSSYIISNFSVQDWNPGAYTIHVSSDNRSEALKLLVVKP